VKRNGTDTTGFTEAPGKSRTFEGPSARSKYVPGKPAENDVGAAPAFNLTGGQLSALIATAVTEALGAHTGGPLLVDKQSLARKIGCSAAHIDNLRKRGLPVVYVGEAVRFEPPAVVEWLRRQGSNDTE
jgi:hypothetical protein